jgi:hypothetical protein
MYRSAGTLTWDSFIVMYDTSLQVGLAISDQNIFCGRQNITGQLVCSGGFPAVPAEFRLFRRNSGCSAELKTLGIPFRTVSLKRKMLGILYSGTKIEANSWNSIPNHSVEEKTTRNSVPKHLTTFEVQTNHFVKLFWLFCKTNFLRIIPFRASE